MERRKFIAATTLASMAAMSFTYSKEKSPTGERAFYEFRKYAMKNGGAVRPITEYFREALIPALNKLGANHIGVFTEWGKSDPPNLYLLIPFSSHQYYLSHFEKLKQDEQYQKKSKAFHQTPEDNRVFSRYSSETMIAFENLPTLIKPTSGESLFELRTYEGFSDDAVRRKVGMFNKEELALFSKVKLNPVFFGHVVSGYNLPKLTYMLAFNDMEQRDQTWKKFVEHPEWDVMKRRSEYADTVSRIEKTFLVSHEVSQI